MMDELESVATPATEALTHRRPIADKLGPKYTYDIAVALRKQQGR